MLDAAVMTPEQRIPQERHRAVRQALGLLVAAPPDLRAAARESAFEVLWQSVHRQARWAGGLEQQQ